MGFQILKWILYDEKGESTEQIKTKIWKNASFSRRRNNLLNNSTEWINDTHHSNHLANPKFDI